MLWLTPGGSPGSPPGFETVSSGGFSGGNGEDGEFDEPLRILEDGPQDPNDKSDEQQKHELDSLLIKLRLLARRAGLNVRDKVLMNQLRSELRSIYHKLEMNYKEVEKWVEESSKAERLLTQNRKQKK